MKQPIPLDFNNLPNNTPQEDYPKGTLFNQNNYDINSNNNNQNYPSSPNQNNYYNQSQTFEQNQMQSQSIQQHQNQNSIQFQQNVNPNINQDLNQFVRNQLKSRGINIGRVNSPQEIKQREIEAKKNLLENIQNQIGLTRNTKLKELQRKKEEDEKYLKDMLTNFPFGRGGGGAPIRDKNGGIVTTRRCLISDPKYNLVTINVDDDYDDVKGKDKKIGLLNFKNRNFYYNTMGHNNNINQNQIIQRQNFNNTVPRNFRPMQNYPNQFQQMTQMQQPIYNDNNYQENDAYNIYNQPNQNIYNNNSYNQIQYQQEPQMQYMNNNRPYSTNPRQFNQSNNQYIDRNMRAIEQVNQSGYNENVYNPNQTVQMQNINDYNNNINISNGYEIEDPNTKQTELNLSYDNYEHNEEKKREDKKIYGNFLLQQIEEAKNRKLKEKQKKAQEEAEEEERLRRENEEIERKLQEERERNQRQLNQTNLINKNAAIEVKTKSQQDTKNLPQANNQISQSEKEQLEKFNQQEIESRMALNNEILKLRDQMQDQQVNLFNQINDLKRETENANMQRYEALKEIELLKEELSKQRADEELRRKYVYDVIADNNSKIGGIYGQTHLPDPQIENINLPVQSEKNFYYDERLRHPNRILPIPKLTELNEDQMKTDSKFIDIDTHNVFNGLEVYHTPTIIESVESKEDYKINNKGYDVSGDFGTLRSFYKDQNLDKKPLFLEEKDKDDTTLKNVNEKFNEDVGKQFEDNINNIEDGILEVNQIYNKNMERLRYLNDLENKFTSGTEIKGGEKDNFDDFIGKINNTCNLNY